MEGSRTLGLVSLRQAGAVPPQERPKATVGEVALTGEDVPTVDPDTPVLQALDVLRGAPGRALVVDDGRLVGILSTSDLARALEMEAARGRLAPPSPRLRGGAPLVAFILVALAAAALYRPPVAVLSPGPALDVASDITVAGVPSDRPTGRYLLTSVEIDQPTALGMMLAAVDPGRDVIPFAAFVPEGRDPAQFVAEQKRLFRESQRLAAAAAARAVGMEVSVSGKGARVVAIVDGSPASRMLRSGDVIVGIDGRPVGDIGDVRSALATRSAGTNVELTIERAGRPLEVETTTTRFKQAGEEVVGIGVLLETTDLQIRLPFEVQFRERSIGGPSAGLAYALAITDMLDPRDIAAGRDIAATGTIDVAGNVGPVGGVDEKAAGAKAAGADLFFVPGSELQAVDEPGLEVRGVQTLEEALRVLQTTA